MQDVMQQTWNDENELLLQQWGERSSVLRILHTDTSLKYTKYSTCVTIPTIVLSTVAGSIQLRVNSCESEGGYIDVILACMNLFIAIIAGVGSILRFKEKAEAHKASASSFGNFYRQVSCELAFPRTERDNPSELLRSMKRHYDALLETSPDIPRCIVTNFKKTRVKLNPSLSLPDICNGLDPIKICKSNTYGGEDDIIVDVQQQEVVLSQ